MNSSKVPVGRVLKISIFLIVNLNLVLLRELLAVVNGSWFGYIGIGDPRITPDLSSCSSLSRNDFKMG